MLTTLFIIAMICAAISGVIFFHTKDHEVTFRDKIAMALFAVSLLSLLVIAYVAGAR
jgi:hypothetical protein